MELSGAERDKWKSLAKYARRADPKSLRDLYHKTLMEVTKLYTIEGSLLDVTASLVNSFLRKGREEDGSGDAINVALFGIIRRMMKSDKTKAYAVDIIIAVAKLRGSGFFAGGGTASVIKCLMNAKVGFGIDVEFRPSLEACRAVTQSLELLMSVGSKKFGLLVVTVSGGGKKRTTKKS